MAQKISEMEEWVGVVPRSTALELSIVEANSNGTHETYQGTAHQLSASPVRNIIDPSHLLELDDLGCYLRFTDDEPKELGVESGVFLYVGCEVHGRNVGAGLLTISEGSGVQINAPAGGSLYVPMGGTFTLKYAGGDEWDLIGVTEAAS